MTIGIVLGHTDNPVGMHGPYRQSGGNVQKNDSNVLFIISLCLSIITDVSRSLIISISYEHYVENIIKN